MLIRTMNGTLTHNVCKYTTFFCRKFQINFLFDKNVVYLLL